MYYEDEEPIEYPVPYTKGETVYTTTFTKDDDNYRTFYSVEAVISTVVKLKIKDWKHNKRSNPADLFKYWIYYQGSNKVKYGSEIFKTKKAASWEARRKQEAFDKKYGKQIKDNLSRREI